MPVQTRSVSMVPQLSEKASMDGDSTLDQDNVWMAAYAAGDLSAFDRLYQSCRLPLFRFLMQHLRNQALADEIFQDVWHKVVVNRTQWRPTASFKSWLFQIAHNRLMDHWRAAKLRPSAPEDAEARLERIAETRTPESELSEFERRRQLQMALERLPDDQRMVLTLRLDQQLSLEDIGVITGVGRETVKSRLRYAMDKLKVEMAP